MVDVVIVAIVAIVAYFLFVRREEQYTPSGRCRPGKRSRCMHTTRQFLNGEWRCPNGWKDTGCSFEDDGQKGGLQCKMCN